MGEKKNKGGNLDKGLSHQEKMEKGYTPRDSGQGERPMANKSEKCGKFTIR